MLIVSQNRTKIVSLKTTELIDISERFSIRVFQVSNDDSFLEIASYEDSKRAKAVLQELWSAYSNGDKVFIMPEK